MDAFLTPYVHYDFDYYLPTVKVALDKGTYGAQAQQQITIETTTMGSDRDLWLSIWIDGPGGVTYTHVQTPGPVPASFRAGVTGTQTLLYDLPAGLAPGSYRVRAELTERGTSDLVDIAVAPFTLQ